MTQEDNMVMQGYTPAAFAPMRGTYQNWLQSQLGTAPLAQAYGASFQPYAELAYLSNPVSGMPGYQGPGSWIDPTGYGGAGTGWSPTEAVNPFQNFLQTSAGGNPYQNLGMQDWAQRARNVQTTLAAQGTEEAPLTEGQLRVQERFGTGEGAADRQRQLAQAPIVSQSPFALRGETQNILNRLYNDWMVNQPATGPDPITGITPAPQGYLQNAMSNLWGRFGVA